MSDILLVDEDDILILERFFCLRCILPLKIPICTFDAKTGILCAKCQNKLDTGQITQADVQVSKALVKLAEKNPDFNKLTLLRSVEADGNYVLEVEQSDAAAFRAKPEMKSKLEELLKQKVWIVGASPSDRRFLEDLFYPNRILTVNTVWLPDGSKLTKVIIPARRGERAGGDMEALKKVVKQVRGIELMIEFEREAALRH